MVWRFNNINNLMRYFMSINKVFINKTIGNVINKGPYILYNISHYSFSPTFFTFERILDSTPILTYLLLSSIKIYWWIEIFSIFLINIIRTAIDYHWLIWHYLISQVLIEELAKQIKFIKKCTLICVDNLSHVEIR